MQPCQRLVKLNLMSTLCWQVSDVRTSHWHTNAKQYCCTQYNTC